MKDLLTEEQARELIDTVTTSMVVMDTLNNWKDRGIIKKNYLEQARSDRDFYLENQTVFFSDPNVKVGNSENFRWSFDNNTKLMTVQNMNLVCSKYEQTIKELKI